ILVAVVNGQRTGPSAIAHAYENTPYFRPIYLTCFPIEGVDRYELYATDQVQHTDGIGQPFRPEIWTRVWDVPVQVDENGHQFFVDDFRGTGSRPSPDGAPVPQGMLPGTFVGYESINGTRYGVIVYARWPFHRWISVYSGTTRLAENHPDILHPDHP